MYASMSAGSLQRNTQRLPARAPLERAARELMARVATVALPDSGAFTRVEVAIDVHASSEPCDMLHWLRAASAGTRRYFRDRTAKCEIGGIGRCVSTTFGQHETWKQQGSGVGLERASAWFVAIPFDSSRARDVEWTGWSHTECVLPEIELRRDGELHTLAVNISAESSRESFMDQLDALAQPVLSCTIEPALVRESDGDGEAQWSRAVRGGLERIRSGALRKIVIARRRAYAASGLLDPVAVLARLAARESRGFRFLVEAGQGKAFLGVTPERLVSRSGRIVRSEAVAGTRPRGVDGVADRLLGESLLASAKDRREHEIVVERVREALATCATSLRVDAQPRLLRLAYVQHLTTRVYAEIRAGVSDADLVALLHPTPAVAGAPVAEAIEALRDFEPFDRGLYAGAVGIVSSDGAEISVAIRSARIDGDRLTAYAGAGIVEGSDAAEEWRETGHKLLAFERLAT